MSSKRPHFVYVAFDADRVPLYAGCTTDVRRRLKEHRPMGWPSRVAHLFVTEFPTRDEALAAETERIQSLRPLYNIRDNPRVKRLVHELETHRWRVEWDRYYAYNFAHRQEAAA